MHRVSSLELFLAGRIALRVCLLRTGRLSQRNGNERMVRENTGQRIERIYSKTKCHAPYGRKYLELRTGARSKLNRIIISHRRQRSFVPSHCRDTVAESEDDLVANWRCRS